LSKAVLDAMMPTKARRKLWEWWRGATTPYMIKCPRGIRGRVGVLEVRELGKCWLIGHPRVHPALKTKRKGTNMSWC
jgi:hypothetical protein